MPETRQFQIEDFTLEMSWQNGGLGCSWDPGVPDEAYFSSIGVARSRKFWKRYKKVRGKFVQSVADEIGAAIIVADVNRSDIPSLLTFRPSAPREAS
ncbi:MAG: hypothetical protein V3V08_05645 [Nannocystaceae bacterium]